MSPPLPSLAGRDWLVQAPLQRVFAALAAAGGEARVAGGAVRNALLGEPIADVDIATTLGPEAIMAAGAAADLGVHPTGFAHGTITLVADRTPFEVTTLRIDVETDGRRAKVAFTSDWQADAARRDFTMNALYCDALGQVYDPVDGYPDLVKRRVRFVGDAEARIREDFLRILRFFRFHARYGKGKPHAEGLEACVLLKGGLRGLSAERIRQEMLKLLAAPRALETLKVMRDSGILAEVLPEAQDFALLKRMIAIDAGQELEPDPLLRIVALVADASELRNRLKLTNKEMARLAALTRNTGVSPNLKERERRAVLYHTGLDYWRDAVRVAWMRSKVKPGDAAWRNLLRLSGEWQPPRLPLTGQDVMAHGVAAGPAVGEALAKLEDWWIASDFAMGRDELLKKLAS